MNDASTRLVKVLFTRRGADGTTVSESLWAAPLGLDRYKIDNCPLFLDRISLGDEIYAPFNEMHKSPVFQDVTTKFGNKTLRLILDSRAKSGNDSQNILESLKALGCGYEGAATKIIALNIPAGVAFETVTSFLSHTTVPWEHADPSYEDLYPE